MVSLNPLSTKPGEGLTILAEGDLVFDDHPFRQLDLVCLLCQGQQFFHFLVQSFFQLAQSFVAHGFALGCIGMDLGPIKADIAYLEHACGLR